MVRIVSLWVIFSVFCSTLLLSQEQNPYEVAKSLILAVKKGDKQKVA